MTSRKKEIKRLIADNKKKEAITELLAILEERTGHFSPDDIQQYEQKLILLSTRLSRNHELIDQDTESLKTTNVEANKIALALLRFVDSLSDRFWAEEEPTDEAKMAQTAQKEVREIPIFQLGEATHEYDVFLCHSDADAAFVDGIYEELKLNGLNVFYSKESLKLNIGDSFFEKISYGMEHSKDFILVCSPAAMQSEWVKVEYETFFSEFHLKDAQNRNFYILQGPDYDIAQVPVLLKRLQISEDVQSILNSRDPSFESEEKKEVVVKEREKDNDPDPIQEDSNYRKIIILLIVGLVFAGFFLLKMCDRDTDDKEPVPFVLDFYNAEIELSKEITNFYNFTYFMPGNGIKEHFHRSTDLLFQDKDLLVIEPKEGDGMYYLFDKKDSFNPLNFEINKSILSLNGDIVGLKIPSIDSLQQIHFLEGNVDFSEIEFIEISSDFSNEYCGQLKNLARINPSVGLYIDQTLKQNEESNVSCIIEKFRPEILFCDLPFLNKFKNTPFINNVKTLILDLDGIGPADSIQVQIPGIRKLMISNIKNETLSKIDFGLLANQMDLRSLAIYGDGQIDVEPISSLVQLTDLKIFSNDTFPDIRPLLRLENLESLSLLGHVQNAGFLNRMNSLKRLSIPTDMTQSNFDQIFGNHKDLEFIEIFLNKDTLIDLHTLKGLPRLKAVGILEYAGIIENAKVNMELFMELDSLKYLTIPKAIYDDEANAHLISKFRNSGRIVVPNEGICLGSGWLLLLPLSILFFLLMRLLFTIVKRKWMNFS